jgi:hypothetical protein
MKIKLFLLLLLFALFGGFLAVKFFILDKQNASGRLKILSSPAAGVFVDNVPVGKTPYEDKYKVGEFMLKLIPEGESSQTASWQGKVKVYKNTLTYVNRELGISDVTSAGENFTSTRMETPPKSSNYGEISVETEPVGSIVYLDNDEKGVAPLLLADVVKGDHELSVFMPGFFRRTHKVNVDPGYRVNASFKLSIDTTQQPPIAEEQKSTPSGEIKPTGTKPTDTKQVATKPTDALPIPQADLTQPNVLIKDTPTGWLRVRSEPSLGGSESARIKPGETYLLLEEQAGWYKIKLPDKDGWISSQYATKGKLGTPTPKTN